MRGKGTRNEECGRRKPSRRERTTDWPADRFDVDYHAVEAGMFYLVAADALECDGNGPGDGTGGVRWGHHEMNSTSGGIPLVPCVLRSVRVGAYLLADDPTSGDMLEIVMESCVVGNGPFSTMMFPYGRT